MKDFYDDDTDYMGGMEDEDNDTIEKEEEDAPGWELEDPTGD